MRRPSDDVESAPRSSVKVGSAGLPDEGGPPGVRELPGFEASGGRMRPNDITRVLVRAAAARGSCSRLNVANLPESRLASADVEAGVDRPVMREADDAPQHEGR